MISIHFSLYKNWLTAFWLSTLLFYFTVRAPLPLSCSQEMIVPGRRTIYSLNLPDPSSWKATSYIYLVWQSHGILFSLVMMEISGWNLKECRSLFFFYNFGMVQIKPFLNANSNFLINRWCCFTLERLCCYVVSQKGIIDYLWMIYMIWFAYVAKYLGTCYYFKLALPLRDW